MALQQSNLQRVLSDLGITPVYEYNGRTFYDTKDVFDRHNFARDVKRNVDEDEWVLEKTKYYLSERGVVMFAFKKGVSKVMERFMRILEMPAFPEVAMPRADPTMIMGVPAADPTMTDRKDFSIYGTDTNLMAAYQNQYQNQSAYAMAMMSGMGGYGQAQYAPQPYLPPTQPHSHSQVPNQSQNQNHGMTKEQHDAYAEAYQQQLQAHYAQQYAQQQQSQLAQQGQGQPQGQQGQGQGQGGQGQQQGAYGAVATDYGVPGAENLKAAAMGNLLHKNTPNSVKWATWTGFNPDPNTSPDVSYESDSRRASSGTRGLVQ